MPTERLPADRNGRWADTQQEADLWFAPTHSPHGFTHAALSHFDGDAEPVVRELLQNSVDAADKAGRACEVRFEIREIHNDELPGFATYRSTFERAVEQRNRDRAGAPPTHDEQIIVDRINHHLSTPTIPVLICSDNGTGITPARMASLLTSGNSDKGDGGAGSFGLGHHAAFSASDLRYVLYASLYSPAAGEKRVVASGHAVLATHIGQIGNTQQIHAHDGYWANDIGPGSLFTQPGEAYPSSAPPVLEATLESMSDTGMAVCIAGFNDFRRDDADATSLEAIAYVAASNFCDAIHRGVLSVTICDRRTGEELSVEAHTLERILSRRRDERRAPKLGQIQGSYAYGALETLRDGHEIELPHDLGSGVSVKVRRIESNVRSRIHLYRKGMWITSSAENLRHNDFSDYLPFDAVASLQEGDLEHYVRSAEGPEHRGIDFKRLNLSQKRKLRLLLRELAAAIRVSLVAKSDQEEFRPDDFAIVQGEATQTLESVGRTRAALGGKRKGHGQGGEKPGKKSGTGAVRSAGKARPGSVPKFAWAPMGTGTSGSDLTVLFSLQEDVPELIGVRLSVPTGSDQTCESPLPQQFLQLRAIHCGGTELARTSSLDGDQELTFAPPQEWTQQRKTLVIEALATPAELAAAQLEIVRRQTPKANPNDTNSGVNTAANMTVNTGVNTDDAATSMSHVRVADAGSGAREVT